MSIADDRRPLPVGVLLSGIDTRIETNNEKLLRRRVIRLPTPPQDMEAGK